MDIDAIRADDSPGLPEGVRRIEYRRRADCHADWALAWPPDKGDRWVVMLHGHGSHGDQLYTRPDLRDQWLPEIRRMGFGILTPNLRDNAWMSPQAAADLHALLGAVRTEWGVRRFLFASGSMGGTGNAVYAVLHPDDVAGVVALCPATDPASYHAWCRARNEGVLREIADAIETSYGAAPDRLPEVYARHSAVQHADRLTMPVYVAHGTGDAVIPVSQSRRLAAAVGDKSDFAYVEIPGGHHDSPLACAAEGLRWVDQQTVL